MKKFLSLFSILICSVTMSAAVTWNVQVPAETKHCYIAGDFNSWQHTEMTKVDDTHYTYTAEDKDADNVGEYKYASGPAWDYEEQTVEGNYVNNRSYNANDVVGKWKAIYNPATTYTYVDITVRVNATSAPTIWWWGAGDKCPNAASLLKEDGTPLYSWNDDILPTMTAVGGSENWWEWTLKDVNEKFGVTIVLNKDEDNAKAIIYTSTCYNLSGNSMVVTECDGEGGGDQQGIIYYVDVNGWGDNVRCYTFTGNTPVEGSVWPGRTMEKADFQLQCYDVYFLATTAENCIFSENGGNQTVDLTIPTNGENTYYNNTWKTRAELEKFSAEKVYLAGDFTDPKWENGPLEMRIEGQCAYVPIHLPTGTHEFQIIIDNTWYGCTSEGVSRDNNTGLKFSTGNNNCQLIADEEGDYTFYVQSDCSDPCIVSVTYPNESTKYRLVYEETGSTAKFHPSEPYIEEITEGSRTDIVSLFVSKEEGLEAGLHRVLLQKRQQKEDGSLKWETIQMLDLASEDLLSGITESGVWDFYIDQATQDADGETTVAASVRLKGKYAGRYYIRTELAENGYKDESKIRDPYNYMSYSDWAAQHRGFNYYWCQYAYYERSTAPNLTFCIANEYSNCVSDTLMGDPLSYTYRNTQGSSNNYDDGMLVNNANIRFMWNSKTNVLARGYIAGEQDKLSLNWGSGIISCSKIQDAQNWVYRYDVEANANATFNVKARPYDSHPDGICRQLVDDVNIDGWATLIAGKDGAQYTVRVIYDFKTDRLIYGMVPKGDISGENAIGCSLFFTREMQNTQPLVFQDDQTSITDIDRIYGVLILNKSGWYEPDDNAEEGAVAEDGKWKDVASGFNTNQTGYQKDNWVSFGRDYFFISFPFDVHVSDIFSAISFSKDQFQIYKYDGDRRSKEGGWFGTTYWTEMNDTDTLKEGEGYLLYVDHALVNAASNETALFGIGDLESIGIYFPSAATDVDITNVYHPKAVRIPEHLCKIERENRNIYDSHWNLIGVPTYAVVQLPSQPEGMQPGKDDDIDMFCYMTPTEGGKFCGFYYRLRTGASNYNTWTPWNLVTGKEDDSDATTSDVTAPSDAFKPMHAYLVQWWGDAEWTQTANFIKGGSAASPSVQGLRARQGAGEQEAEEYTLRLTMSSGETMLDQTFVRLQEEGGVTTGFDFNYDMVKIINDGVANLYSLVGDEQIEAGANVQPLPDEEKVIVPLGVTAATAGTYTLALPDGTDGINVVLKDYYTGVEQNLALDGYSVFLDRQTSCNDRFALEISPRSGVTTSTEQTSTDNGQTVRKVMIDGVLYIQYNGETYTATGAKL